MKRDLELVRAILLALEASPHGVAVERFTIEGYDQETIRCYEPSVFRVAK